MKDCFNRENRRLKNPKSEAAASRKTPYIYYHQLTVLNKNGEVNETHTSIPEEVSDVENEGPYSSQNSSQRNKKKKRKIEKEDEVGKELVEVLKARNMSNKSNQFNETEMFLLSLRKEMDKIPEYLQLQTRMKLLEVIHDAQQQSGQFTHNRGYFTQTQARARNTPITTNNNQHDFASNSEPQPSTSYNSIQSPGSTISSQDSNNYYEFLDMYDT